MRAASAVVPFGDGHLVISDDAIHAAWFRRGGNRRRLRLLPPVDGEEVFDEESGTKHLKPDLEAACEVSVDGAPPAVLVMGSGSSPRRMRWCLVRLEDGTPDVVVSEMVEVYAAAAAALDVDLDALNLEGACVVGRSLRWFHRGLPSAGLPSGSVDLDLDAVWSAALGEADAADLRVTRPRGYELGSVDGVGLRSPTWSPCRAVTCSRAAAAEDSPDPRDDGPVTATALARLRGDRVDAVVRLPDLDGRILRSRG